MPPDPSLVKRLRHQQDRTGQECWDDALEAADALEACLPWLKRHRERNLGDPTFPMQELDALIQLIEGKDTP